MTMLPAGIRFEIRSPASREHSWEGELLVRCDLHSALTHSSADGIRTPISSLRIAIDETATDELRETISLGRMVSRTSELGLRAASTGTKTVGYRVARKLTLSLVSSFRPNVPRPGKLMVEQVVA